MPRRITQSAAALCQTPIERSEVAKPPQEIAQQRRQAEIDQADAGHQARTAIGQRIVEAADVGAEQFHATDIEGRQHQHAQGHRGEAAQPLQQGAPQQNAGRGILQVAQHGGVGGGDAAGGLEQRVGDGQMQSAEMKGQRRHQGQQQPARHHQQDRLAHRQAAGRMIEIGQHQHQPGEQAEAGHRQEHRPIRVALKGVGQRRQRQSQREQGQQQA
jgi:hypothetical protein